MRGMVAPVMVLMLALLHAPPQAQALFFDFLPSDLLELGASEPVTLVLTAVALLSLARVGTAAARGASEIREAETSAARPELDRRRTPTSSERAA